MQAAESAHLWSEINKAISRTERATRRIESLETHAAVWTPFWFKSNPNPAERHQNSAPYSRVNELGTPPHSPHYWLAVVQMYHCHRRSLYILSFSDFFFTFLFRESYLSSEPADEAPAVSCPFTAAILAVAFSVCLSNTRAHYRE